MRFIILCFALTTGGLAHAGITCDYREVETVRVRDPLTENVSEHAGAPTFAAGGEMTRSETDDGITVYTLTVTDSKGHPFEFTLRLNHEGDYVFRTREQGGAGGTTGHLDGRDFDSGEAQSFSSYDSFGRTYRCHGTLD